MAVKEELKEGIAILSPEGKIFNLMPVVEDTGQEIGVYKELKRSVERLVESGVKHLVLDMGGVPAIDSAGLGGLVSLMSTIGRVDGRLVLCRLTPEVESIFDLTDLFRFFEVFTTREEAVKAFSN